MKLFGAIATLFALALVGLGAWRIVRGFELWFDANPAAGNLILWSLVAALVLAVFAIPAGAWGLAARSWVVKLSRDQHLASTAHALIEAQQRIRFLEEQRQALIAAPQHNNLLTDGGNVHASDYHHPEGRECRPAAPYRGSDVQ